MSVTERGALRDARAALRSWAGENYEGRVMTIVEDASIVDYITVVLDALARAAYVAENLHGMIDSETWRSTGGDDGQGHYEGDYRAEQIHAEILSWKEQSDV